MGRKEQEVEWEKNNNKKSKKKKKKDVPPTFLLLSLIKTTTATTTINGNIITTTKTDHTVDDDDDKDDDRINSHNISDDESNSDDNDNDDSSSSSSSSTSIMIQSLPIVIVNLERLCGYAVTEAERDEITQQVRQALLGNNNDNDVNGFEILVTELFKMKVAYHGNDSNTNSTTFDNDDKYCVVNYPELLYPTDGGVVSIYICTHSLRLMRLLIQQRYLE